MRTKLVGTGTSHRGLVRSTNEDRYLIDNEHSIYAVADGIGGLPFGEKASECAIRVLNRVIKDESTDNQTNPLEIIAAVHQAVRQISGLMSSDMGMGTTFTFLRGKEDSCEIGHVGDSTAFLITEAKIIQMTSDHVQSAPSINIISTSENISTKNRYLGRKRLSRYIGQSEPLEPLVFAFKPKIGDRVIICSDGISSVIEPSEIHSVSQAQNESLKLANALIQIANFRGGNDNATVIVIECIEYFDTSVE